MKILSRLLLFAFIAALVLMPVSVLVMHYQDKPIKGKKELSVTQQQEMIAMLSLTPSPTATPIPLPSGLPDNSAQHTVKPSPSHTPTVIPTQIAAHIQSADENNVIQEVKSTITGIGFTFTIPSSWLVQTTKSNNIYSFFFSPTKTMDYGQVMTIELSKPATSIQMFLAENYPKYTNQITYSNYGSIGNKIIYRIAPKTGVTFTDPELNSLGSFGVVLGKKYSYVISFDDNGTRDIIDEIERVIWPTFRFE